MGVFEKVTVIGDTSDFDAKIKRSTALQKQFDDMVRRSGGGGSGAALGGGGGGPGFFGRGGAGGQLGRVGRFGSLALGGFGIGAGINAIAGAVREYQESSQRRRNENFEAQFGEGSRARQLASQASDIRMKSLPTYVANTRQITEGAGRGLDVLIQGLFGTADSLKTAQDELRNFGQELSGAAALARGDAETLSNLAKREAGMRAKAIADAMSLAGSLNKSGSGFSSEDIRKFLDAVLEMKSAAEVMKAVANARKNAAGGQDLLDTTATHGRAASFAP